MRCFIQFANDSRWIKFRYAELDGLLRMNGVDPTEAYSKPDDSEVTPFLILELPNEEVAKRICSRSILIKHSFEFWAFGVTLDELIENTKKLPDTFIAQYTSEKLSWSIDVDVYFKSYTKEEKEECRNMFRFLPFQGKVQLQDTDIPMFILLDYSCDDKLSIPCYLGRLLAHGGMREELKKYDLKSRLYLGPTR